MSDHYAQAHHLTTSDSTTTGNTTSGNTTFGDQSNFTSGRNAQSGTSAENQASSDRDTVKTGTYSTYAYDQASSGLRQTNTTLFPSEDTISAAPGPSARGPTLDLNHEHEPRSSISQAKRGSLAATEGPFQVPTTDDVSKSGVPPTSSVGQQNAPGRAGSVGEKAMSAMGYGGNHVERPKEEQGLGEKIVNFLGA